MNADGYEQTKVLKLKVNKSFSNKLRYTSYIVHLVTTVIEVFSIF